MNYWIITDTHFDHYNMIRVCNRPEHFEDLIMEGLGRVASPKDILIHLGDVAWKNVSKWHYRLGQFSFRRRYLVIGNHDGQGTEWYLNHGWSCAVHSLSLDIFGERILFSHKPMMLGEHTLNIHGHFHNISQEHWELPLKALYTPRHKLVSLEQQEYKPVNLVSLIGK